MMGVYWLLITLLCCTSSSRCNKQQVEMQCRPAENPEPVFVPCPNMTTEHAKGTEQVTFKLFRNNEIISQDPQQPANQTDVHPVKDENGKVSGFKLTRKAITKQAVYICEGTFIYPPPVKSISSTSVLVLEEGQGCQCKTEISTIDDQQKTDKPLWIWIVVVVLLCTYSLAVTIAALIIWHKMKDADSQSDYMNTKPRPPAKRRKKRELQHPIPRHF